MNPYHKIRNAWKRSKDNPSSLLYLDWTTEAFRYLSGCYWRFTEKVDGQNIRVIVDDNGVVTFHGRTDRAELPKHVTSVLSEAFGGRSEALTRALEHRAGCLYGEAYGAKIQKAGRLYRPDGGHGFVLFDVRRANGTWAPRSIVQEVGEQLCIDVVPEVEVEKLSSMMKNFHRGIPIKSRWGNFVSEGVIGVPLVPLYTGKERVIVKIKSKDFGMPMREL